MSVNITEGVRWILSCTSNFDSTVAFFQHVMGMATIEEGVPVHDKQFSRYAVLKMPNNVVLEILEPREAARDLYQAPIVSITVDDVAQARREMERRQVELVGPIVDTKQGWGWTYFRAPDANIYQIQGPYAE